MNGQFSKPSAGLWLAGLASLALHAMVVLLPYVVPHAATLAGAPGPASPGLLRPAMQVRLLPAQDTRTSSGLTSWSAAAPVTQADPVTDPLPMAAEAAPAPGSARPESFATPPQPPQPSQPGLQWLPLVSQPFYPVEQLDEKPRLLVTSELDTDELRPIVASGILVLGLWIDVTGRVVRVDIERSDLPPVFVHAAVAAFERMRFSPGQRAGQLVGSVLRIEVRYDDGRQPAAAVPPVRPTEAARPAEQAVQP